MQKKKFNKKVQAWMERIEANCIADPHDALECCDLLEQYAYDVDSNELRGYCLFYKGFSYYTLYKLGKSFECLHLSIEYLTQNGQWALVARAYNALGNISHFQGESSQSIDYFFTGLRICRENDLQQQSYSILSNIANIYISLGEYRIALAELEQCEEMMCSDPEVNGESLIVVYINLATCCTSLGLLDRAETYIARSQELAQDNALDRISILLLKADFFKAKGDFASLNRTIEALHSDDFSYVVFDLLNEVSSYARLLIDIERYDVLEKLFTIISEQADTLYGQEMLCTLKLEYYKKINDQQKYLQETARYFELSELRRHQKRQIAIHNIIARRSLEKEVAIRTEAERSNSILREKSEHDALTGINNRYMLNELSEAAFQKAYMDGTPLTVEILDIDCYKQFNDNYGHQAGDVCLQKIAKALRFLEEYEGIHLGRYGGDEFMVIYENYQENEVRKFAEKIKETIASLNIEHKYSSVAPHVTVSQGIYGRIPSGANKLWDFTFCADLALYAVKRNGRNNYFIASSLPEIRAYAGEYGLPGD